MFRLVHAHFVVLLWVIIGAGSTATLIALRVFS
jgi:hypothetical protein